jgi:hypothetical protein
MDYVLPAFLVLQGAAFLVWAALAFHWLFALRAEAVAKSGRTLPGMGAQLAAFRAGLVEPRYRRHRIKLLIATGVLMTLTLVFAVVFR